MAETKQIGKLENLITFKIDKTSFDAARKKIQQIKNEMKGISKPLQEALKPARAAQKIKSDYLVVQKQLDKVEKQQLRTAESLVKARNKQKKCTHFFLDIFDDSLQYCLSAEYYVVRWGYTSPSSGFRCKLFAEWFKKICLYNSPILSNYY